MVQDRIDITMTAPTTPLPTTPAYPILQQTNELLPSLPLYMRKEIMTALRVGVMPKHSIRLKLKLLKGRELESIPIFDSTGTIRSTITYRSLWELLEPMLETPIRRSMLSVALRATPITKEEAESTVSESITKELSCTQRLDLSPSLQYPFFYSFRDCVYHRIHPDIPHRPEINILLRKRLLHWKRYLSDQLLIPQFSQKRIGRESCRIFEEHLYPDLPEIQRPCRIDYSTRNLEQSYKDDGIFVEGPCEARVAWKFNDLKPRVYYAIGSTSYFGSRYVWRIFDSLQRMNLCTDPNRRYSFMRFPYIDLPQSVFLVYDYASFTSRLVDFHRFVHELAIFLADTSCWIFDTHHGMVRNRLSDILHAYNASCNDRGTFDIQRVVEISGRKAAVVNHEVAGMLGVFGNITGSTSLHGFIGLSISGSDDCINAIGDDAGMVVNLKEMDITGIKEAIRTIGDIADEKFEIFEEDQAQLEMFNGWHYVKRSVVIDSGLVKQGWMPDFPILPRIFGTKLDHITVRVESFPIRRGLLIKQTCRFLDSVTAHIDQVTEQDIGLILSILGVAYRRMKLRTGGSLPSKYYRPSDNHPYPHETLCVPELSEESIRNGWFKTLKSRDIEGGMIQVPLVIGEDNLPEELYIGQQFVHSSDPVLNCISKLGIVEKEPLYEDRLITEETLEILENVVFHRVRVLYLYTVLTEYPQWTSYLMCRPNIDQE